jgi:hypothetical protein
MRPIGPAVSPQPVVSFMVVLKSAAAFEVDESSGQRWVLRGMD